MRFSGSVRLRPVRIGFLVAPNDLSTIRRVMRLCNCLWGGRYNPIIPYFEDSPARWINRHYQLIRGLDIARGYINFFEPDVLIEASHGMANKLGWSEDHGYFDLPRVASIDKFFEIDTRKRVHFIAGEDVFDVIAHLYDQEYKYERRHKRPFALIDPGDDPFFELFGGAYPTDESLKYIAGAYRDAFDPETLPASSDTYLKFVRDGYTGPSWITRHALEESRATHRDQTIFVLDPKDPEDLIEAWNYRLVEGTVLPVNLNLLNDHAEFLRDLIKRRHQPIPDNPFGTLFHTNLEFAGSISGQAAAELVASHFGGLPQNSFFTNHYPTMWEVRTERYVSIDRKIIVTSRSRSFDEEVDADGYARIPTLEPDFRGKGSSYTSSNWINVIRPSNNYRDQDVAIAFPSNLWKLGFPRLRSTDQVIITREGWAVPQRYSVGYLLLQPIGGRTALIEWLATQGIKALPSEAGQVAAQVISAAGSLPACGMFADRETVDLLNSMAESHSEQQRAGRSVRRFAPDRTKHRNEIKQHFALKAKRSLGFWNNLNYFLERSVFRAGLRVQCPICAYYNWFDLDAITYKPVCARCLNEFRLGQSPDDLKNLDWYYRVMGPFAAPDYVRGGYAVALTLRCIAERHDSELTWSTGLDLKELESEIDFAGWYRRGFVLSDNELEEPSFFIGEAKSFGRDAFDKKSLDHLRTVAERFPGAYVIVSSLKTIADYTGKELDSLRELAQWGRVIQIDGKLRNPLIVLTGVELFSDRGIRQAWQAAGEPASRFVQHAAVDLTDLYQLAECTQQLYLGLPPFYADFQTRRNVRAASELHTNRLRLIKLLKARSKLYIT